MNRFIDGDILDAVKADNSFIEPMLKPLQLAKAMLTDDFKHIGNINLNL